MSKMEPGDAAFLTYPDGDQEPVTILRVLGRVGEPTLAHHKGPLGAYVYLVKFKEFPQGYEAGSWELTPAVSKRNPYPPEGSRYAESTWLDDVEPVCWLFSVSLPVKVKRPYYVEEDLYEMQYCQGLIWAGSAAEAVQNIDYALGQGAVDEDDVAELKPISEALRARLQRIKPGTEMADRTWLGDLSRAKENSGKKRAPLRKKKQAAWRRKGAAYRKEIRSPSQMSMSKLKRRAEEGSTMAKKEIARRSSRGMK